MSAVFLRELQDMKDKGESNVLTLKAALLATGNVAFADLFPDESTDDEEAAKTLTDDGDETGTDAVTYRFTQSSEEFDPEEADRLLDELLGADGGDMTLSGREILDWGDDG